MPVAYRQPGLRARLPRLFNGPLRVVTSDEIAQIKRDYDRDGFVILRGFMHGREFDELRERAVGLSTELFERQRHGERHPSRRHPQDVGGSEARCGRGSEEPSGPRRLVRASTPRGQACAPGRGPGGRRARSRNGGLVRQAGRIRTRDRTASGRCRASRGTSRGCHDLGSRSTRPIRRTVASTTGVVLTGRNSRRVFSSRVSTSTPTRRFRQRCNPATPSSTTP